MVDETNTQSKSTASLLSDAASHMSGLVRKEVDLARAEVSENVTRAAVAIGLIAGALIFVLTALHVLSAALVAGIAELGIDAGWAALIVGVIYLIIAVIMVRKGTNDLKASSLAPTRTAENVRRDAATVRETMNG
jgi:uncharacterized membrane protein YqjE